MPLKIFLLFFTLLIISETTLASSDTTYFYYDSLWVETESKGAVFIGKSYPTEKGQFLLDIERMDGQVAMSGSFKDKDLNLPIGVFKYYNDNGDLETSLSFNPLSELRKRVDYYPSGNVRYLEYINLPDSVKANMEEYFYLSEEGVKMDFSIPRTPVKSKKSSTKNPDRFMNEIISHSNMIKQYGYVNMTILPDKTARIKRFMIPVTPDIYKKVSDLVSIPIYESAKLNGEKVDYNWIFMAEVKSTLISN